MRKWRDTQVRISEMHVIIEFNLRRPNLSGRLHLTLYNLANLQVRKMFLLFLLKAEILFYFSS